MRGAGAAISVIGIAVVGLRRTVPLVAAVAMEEMHQRTERQQQERQGTHQVGTVLGEGEESRDREEAEEDPGQRGAPLRVGAGCWLKMETMICHDSPFRLSSWAR